MPPSQSLYREFRPQRFSEVLGQDHVVRALRNAVRDGRVAHAYLFSGPRGTGKTSTARILAKALNCFAPEDGEPCCRCDSCLAIAAGTSFDVHEHDAASKRKLDEMRALLDGVALGTAGRFKVYILDEVHQLTKDAESALLKTLEEPPSNVMFVLATTDPQKVPDTIRSRTQHFQFHLLPVEILDAHVRDVVARASLDVDEEGIDAVLREGGGSARDTLSALDRLAAGGGIDDDHATVDQIVEALADRDAAGALTAVAAAAAAGRDARTLTELVVAQLRDAFLSLFAPALVALPEADRHAVAERAQRLGRAGATRSMELLGEALVEMRHAPDPRLLLDVVLVRLTRAEADTSPSALAERLERLEHRMAAGVPSIGLDVPDAPSAGARSTASRREPESQTTPGGVAAARAALGSARAAAPGAAPTQAPPSPAPREPAPVAPSTPVAPTLSEVSAPALAAPAPAPVAPTAPASSGPAFPDRDQLTLAWGDRVVGTLKAKSKALFLAGRFVSADDGVAVFALPNEHHRERCEPLRSEIEGALSAHFKVPIRLRLVADDATRTSQPGPPQPDEDDLDVRIDDLVDAPHATARTTLDHLTDAFPGARLVVED